MKPTGTECESVRRAVVGEAETVQLLLLDHQQRLGDYLQRHLPRELRALYDVDDIIQDTLIEALRRLGQFEPRGENALYRWLVTIARHRLQYLLRSQRTLKRRGPAPVENGNRGFTDSFLVKQLRDLALYKRTPSQSAARLEAMAALEKALEAIPEDFRQAIRMRYLQHVSVAAAAVVMGRSRHAFHMLCHRGLAALRVQLQSGSLYLS
jgi:RNA polymerase sigma-70 factor (ECF subfamily)